MRKDQKSLVCSVCNNEFPAGNMKLDVGSGKLFCRECFDSAKKATKTELKFKNGVLDLSEADFFENDKDSKADGGICPQCKTGKMMKKGVMVSGNGRYARMVCNECGFEKYKAEGVV